jgi:hypothetical protein
MQHTHRAVSKEGTVGGMACYVLEDGRVVFTKRTVVKLLSGGGGDTGDADLSRRLARLPKDLASTTVFVRFIRPGGGIGHGVDDETLGRIFEAYTDGLVNGTLHAQQVPVAQRAYAVWKKHAALGLRTHGYLATGYDPNQAMPRLSAWVERLFRKEPGEWTRMFDHEVTSAIAELYGLRMQGNRIPRWMGAVFDKLYRLTLGTVGKQTLKALNPTPHYGSNHHQYLQPEAQEEFRRLTKAIAYLARRSGRSVDYFWHQVGELLGTSPGVQVELPHVH